MQAARKAAIVVAVLGFGVLAALWFRKPAEKSAPTNITPGSLSDVAIDAQPADATPVVLKENADRVSAPPGISLSTGQQVPAEADPNDRYGRFPQPPSLDESEPLRDVPQSPPRLSPVFEPAYREPPAVLALPSEPLVDEESQPAENFDWADRGPPVEEIADRPVEETRPPDRSARLEDRQFRQTHIIEDGDTLPRIARRYLGDAARSGEIFEFNREVISNPEILRIGAVLKIPSRAASSRPAADLSAEPREPPRATDAPSQLEAPPLVPIPGGLLDRQ